MTEEQKIIQAYNSAHMKIGFLVMDIERLTQMNAQLQKENKQLKEQLSQKGEKTNDSTNSKK